MTLKKRRVKLAKALRQLTGLSLPRSMAVARALSRNNEFNLPERQWVTLCECCGPEPMFLTPKGQFEPSELRLLANQFGF